MGAPMGGLMPGARGLGGMRGALDELERREVTLQTADGTTTQRLEQGTVDDAAADALAFSLASGEAAAAGLAPVDERPVVVKRELAPTSLTVNRGVRSAGSSPLWRVLKSVIS